MFATLIQTELLLDGLMNLHGPQKKHHSNTGASLIFPPAVIKQLLAIKVGLDICDAHRMNLNYCNLLTFPVEPPENKTPPYSVKYVNIYLWSRTTFRSVLLSSRIC